MAGGNGNHVMTAGGLKQDIPLPLDRRTPLSADDVTKIEEDARAALEMLPESVFSLPRIVMNLALLDLTEGICRRRARDGLIEEGYTREQAKAMVWGPPLGADGTPRPSSSYLQVYQRSIQLPTSIVYGGVGFNGQTLDGRTDISQTFERGMARLMLLHALLGWSTNNGGGPGVMRWVSRLLVDGLDRCSQAGIASSSKVIQVLLRIGREPPNGYGSEGFVVRPIDSLHARTRMLMTLGMPLGIFFAPGGFGTLEETGETLSEDQLFGEIQTSMQHQAPLFFIDFRSNAVAGLDPHWVHEFIHARKRWLNWKCIKEKDVARHHILDIEDPCSIDRAIEKMDECHFEIYGTSAITDFRERHGKSVFECADELLAT